MPNCSRLLNVAYRSRAGNRHNASSGELRGEPLNRILRETAKNQRSLNWLQVVRIRLGRFSRKTCEARPRGFAGRIDRAACAGRSCLGTAIQRVDLQHLIDRSHAGNRFLRELANAKRERAGELAVEVDGTAAHACNHARVLGFLPSQAHQDDVAFGAIGVLKDAQYLDIHRFGFCALEDRVRNPAHAGVNFAERNSLS